MKLTAQSPKKSLNKAYLKEKVSRANIELFKKNLTTLFNNIGRSGDEEHLKSQITYFLRDTWYRDTHQINPIEKSDLAIHTGKSVKDNIGVIIEVKSINNKPEMITAEKPNAKALHELILYYLRERIDNNKNEIKHLVITNIEEWYIFDANEFDKKIYRDTAIKKLYELKKADHKDNPFFYEELRKLLAQNEVLLDTTHFNINDFKKIVLNSQQEDDNKLIALYKILSPEHLLKQAFANDSNSLDTKFYAELLHIIGLEEVKEGSKKLIKRKEKPATASLLENTIIKLEDKDCLRNISNLSTFGSTKQEQLFNIALELCITWVNRVLFLKLLEAQLSTYHKGNKDYLFLNAQTIFDFDELSNLFFQVLAEKPSNRRKHVQEKFGKVPYLNSSLFERTELERQSFDVSALDNRLELSIHDKSVLKKATHRAKTSTLPVLQYFFEFLDAYDFSAEGSEEIQEENKNLINASVLGLIFEKINGYKDGSFFTPGFVTMYMCRETIRRAVVQKFNEAKGWKCESIETLYDKIEDKKEANAIINSLKICDPAVGSGHFLVSALNEIIAIKSELKILLDRHGKTLRDYHVEVVNDELIVTDEDGLLFEYNPKNKESQRIQETLFHEKEVIIENCLFGVDINPNSVKICRLRLWIELLKNAYYTEESRFTELETLPNIDINIKCGNSLISRFALDADLSKALKKSKWNIDSYKIAVQTYRDAETKEQKRSMEQLIDDIKSNFRSEISDNDPKVIRKNKLGGELYNLLNQQQLFDKSMAEQKANKQKQEKLEKEINKLATEIDEIKSNKIYENAFEWRFEFPEVLDNDGNFIGFDVVIGNPPYLTGSSYRELHKFFQESYFTSEYQLDLYTFFIELSEKVLASSGVLSLITPNSWLKNLKMSKTRKFILEKFSIVNINPNINKAFEEAQVDTLIFVAGKKVFSKEIEIWSFDSNNNFNHRHSINQSSFIENEGLVFDVEVNPEIRKILSKIRSQSIKLEDEFEITRGVNPYDKYRGQSQEIIQSKAYHADHKKDATFFPELRGKHVAPFSYLWDGKHYISYGNWLAAARDPKFFAGKRLLFREIISSRFVCTQIEEDFIIDRSIYIARPIKEQTNVGCVLGILSSKLLVWLFRYEKNEFDELFPKIRLEEFKKLPIPKNKEGCNKIETITSQIISSKKVNSKADTSVLENKIDQLVYEIYGLTEDEIKVVEQN